MSVVDASSTLAAQRAATSERRVRPSRRARIVALGPTYGALFALALIVIGNVLFTPAFATVQNAWNIGLQVSTTVLVACGMTLVMATAGIDLSVGSVMAVASVVATTLLPRGLGLALMAGLAAALAIGMLNGVLIAKFNILPIIVTLATLIIGRGIAQVMVEGSATVAFSNAGFEFFGKGRLGPIPVQVVVMLVVLAATAFVVRRTSLGRYIVCVGGNEAASRLAGVRVASVKVSVYAATALLAGLAGLIETARLGATDAGKIGQGIELDAIAAAVVGGTPLTGGRASIGGTLVGALIMGVITTSFNMHLVSYSWAQVFKAAIILLAVYVQRPKIA